jgi:DNA processing protein
MLGVQSLGPIAPRRVSDSAGPATATTHPQIAAANGEAPAAAAAASGAAMSERDAWIVLLSVEGLGPVIFGGLLEAFGSAAAVLELAGGELGPERIRDGYVGVRRGEGESGPGRELPAAVARRTCEAAQSGPRLLARVAALGIDAVTLEDPDYPARLRLVDMPPPLLFVRGNRHCLDMERMVAVVGTRRATDKGRLVSGWIAAGLANLGACVVSGLAVGIDGAAHAATVGAGGHTVAVLGGGHGHLFPKSHERLAEAIVSGGGAIVSEYAPDTLPSRGTFPRRNRLVSGMSDATVVVEAGRRSGALITAGWALEQGRDCFLVPGALDAPASSGCLAFLRAFPGQARVVCGVPELLEDLGLTDATATAGAPGTPAAELPSTSAPAVLASLSPLERDLASRLIHGPATADELVRASGASAAAVLSALTLLELRGLAGAGYGRYVPAGPLLRAGVGVGGGPGRGSKHCYELEAKT